MMIQNYRNSLKVLEWLVPLKLLRKQEMKNAKERKLNVLNEILAGPMRFDSHEDFISI